MQGLNSEWVQWRPHRESKHWDNLHLSRDGKGCDCSAGRREAQGNGKQKEKLLSMLPWDNLLKLKHIPVCLNIRKHFLTVRVGEHWNRFLREVVVSLPVEISKTWKFPGKLPAGEDSLIWIEGGRNNLQRRFLTPATLRFSDLAFQLSVSATPLLALMLFALSQGGVISLVDTNACHLK